MKKELRREILQNRKNLTDDEVIEKSKQIKQNLFNMREFKKAQRILFYISYNHEVYTHDMIRESLLIEKQVIVPVADKKNKRLLLSNLNNWHDLEPGSYNILEPKKEKIMEVCHQTIDVIITPGIVFDEKGHRIGHGLGYYDRLLGNCPRAIHIALAFELQIVEAIFVEDHDVPVDKIVTEKRVIDCL